MQDRRPSDREKIEADFKQKIDAIVSEIERTAPNLKALDQYKNLQEKGRGVTEEFELARKEEKQVVDAEEIRVVHGSFRNIDRIYKQLTKSDENTGKECIKYLKEQRLPPQDFHPSSVGTPNHWEAKVLSWTGERFKVVSVDGILLSKSGTMTGGTSGGMEARSNKWDDKKIEACGLETSFWGIEEHTLEFFPSRVLDDTPVVQPPSTLFNVTLELYSRKGLSYIDSPLGLPLYMDLITTSKERLEFSKVVIPWMPPSCTSCNSFGHLGKTCADKVQLGVKPVQVWRIKDVSSTSTEPVAGAIDNVPTETGKVANVIDGEPEHHLPGTENLLDIEQAIVESNDAEQAIVESNDTEQDIVDSNDVDFPSKKGEGQREMR
ncbi:hypothetical protein V6N13_048091 [Hibiscus sabdariffa]